MAGLYTVDDVLAYMDIPMPEDDDLSEDDFEGYLTDDKMMGTMTRVTVVVMVMTVRMMMGIIVVMGTIVVMVMTTVLVFLNTLSIRAAHAT